ncbi:DUF1877 family protein [Streptomyces atratus]|uniref:DUF1877 family protein n=1 Tax=Streptomyces atratus TaxID=1893 RepID=UPI0022583579|nr:DUF1877 family protein [Streptomyces atratus]MCX5341817.1 YfbM family protein [Streptomyces atratus]
MGFWMGITRHDYAEILRLLDHPDGPDAGRERIRDEWNSDDDYHPPGSLLRTLESTCITRTWDAIHVLLTGCENVDMVDFAPPTGEPPASDVIMGGLVIGRRGGHGMRMNNLLLLTPDEVRAVDRFLQGLDLEEVIRERADLLDDVSVYSFYTTIQGEDGSDQDVSMIEDGILASDLAILSAFYARAAEAGHAVIKDIS